MICTFNHSGQLCNRLLLFAHCCATAIDTNQSFVHFYADDIIDFASLDPDVLRRFHVCVRDSFFFRCLNYLLQRYGERCRRVEVSSELAKNARRRSLFSSCRCLPKFVLSWFYRDPGALMRHRDEIREILKPKRKYCDAPEAFVRRMKSGRCKVVGVHLRRGDYREFCGGRLMFSDADYIRFIRQAQDVLGGVNGVRFLLVSNEPIQVEAYRREGVDAVVFAGADFREDLVALSCCDYVMGPISTFSWWAAYFGRAKYRPLRGRDDCIATGNGFKEIVGNESDLDLIFANQSEG